MARILIIDDEKSVGVALRQLFEYEGHRVHICYDGPSGLLDYPEVRPDVTFLDVKMPRVDGLEVLGRIRKEDPAAVVIMISGHGTIKTAVEATPQGAFDFLEKPLDTDRLLVTLRNALTCADLPIAWSASPRRSRSTTTSWGRHRRSAGFPADRKWWEPPTPAF